MSVRWVSVGASALASNIESHLPLGLRMDKVDWRVLFETGSHTPAQKAVLLVLEVPQQHVLQPDTTLARALPEPDTMTLVLLPSEQCASSTLWLNAGADRCISNENAPLVLAMVRAMLRRSQGRASAFSVHGPLQFDHDARALFHQTHRLLLTSRETQVAALMFKRGSQHVKTADIQQALGMSGSRRSNTALVSLYVHRLNRKIRPYGVQIVFTRGYGYRLRTEPQPTQPPVKSDWLAPLFMHRSPRAGLRP